MSIILYDALNLSYFIVRTTVTSAITGGAWLYDKIATTTTGTDTANGVNANSASGAETSIITVPIKTPTTLNKSLIELSEAEFKLLGSFMELPSWQREQYICGALLQHNNELLSNFSFGERGPLVNIRFVDFRTNLILGGIYIRIDPELTIENLRDAMKLQAPGVKPLIHDRDWYIKKAETESNIPTYNPQLMNQHVQYRIHLKLSDSVSVIQSIKMIDYNNDAITYGQNYGLPESTYNINADPPAVTNTIETIDVFVDI